MLISIDEFSFYSYQVNTIMCIQCGRIIECLSVCALSFLTFYLAFPPSLWNFQQPLGLSLRYKDFTWGLTTVSLILDLLLLLGCYSIHIHCLRLHFYLVSTFTQPQIIAAEPCQFPAFHMIRVHFRIYMYIVYLHLRWSCVTHPVKSVLAFTHICYSSLSYIRP